MEFKDLQPIITIMTEQEERLSKKIGEVHSDVKDTNAKISQQNGRLRNVEIKVAEKNKYCEIRSELIDNQFKELEVVKSASKVFKIIGKNPKVTGLILFGTMYISLVVTLVAIDRQWIGQLFKALIP